jgi:FkbM family methyltransferase
MLRKFIRTVGQYLVARTKQPLPAGRTDLKKWFQDKGDRTLRLDYELHENSVVFDLGGYEGQWAADIYCKYSCHIFVFEPSLTFFNSIKSRFLKNDKVKIFQFGLAAKDSQEKLFLQQDGSSMFSRAGAGEGKFEIISLQDICKFASEYEIDAIHLMKVNIEGGEYDLLERIISSGLIHKIDNIQIQFHEFVDNAERRMKSIQDELSKTHEPTYQYNFVWENWKNRTTP